jgi:voltage-gated potassium channel Kch
MPTSSNSSASVRHPSLLSTPLFTQAIVIYSATFLNHSDNWLEAIQRDHEEPVVKYFYSLYFTATTMFTVGYGDIIPQKRPSLKPS